MKAGITYSSMSRRAKPFFFLFQWYCFLPFSGSPFLSLGLLLGHTQGAQKIKKFVCEPCRQVNGNAMEEDDGIVEVFKDVLEETDQETAAPDKGGTPSRARTHHKKVLYLSRLSLSVSSNTSLEASTMPLCVTTSNTWWCLS